MSFSCILEMKLEGLKATFLTLKEKESSHCPVSLHEQNLKWIENHSIDV